MENQKTSKQYNYLVLIDFLKPSLVALKYTISLAKASTANIHLFHIAKPADIVKSDNQAEALRAIDKETGKIKTQLQALIEMVQVENISAYYNYSIGDIYTKINQQIELSDPDLVVIGESKQDKNQIGAITSYLLNNYTGNVLRIKSSETFDENTAISLECSNETLQNYSPNLFFDLLKNSKPPLKIFIDKNKKEQHKTLTFPASWQKLEKIDSKICIKNRAAFSTASNIAEHIRKEKIDLICIGRKRANKSILAKFFNQPNKTSEIILKSNIPVLVLGNAPAP